MAGRAFGPEAIDCAGARETAGLRLAWGHALAWEGDGASGAFRVTRDAGGALLGEPCEATWRKIWLSHRIEPELLEGQRGGLFMNESRRFAYVIQGTSGPLQHVMILHYRYTDRRRRSLGKSAGDTWFSLPTRRRIRRLTTDFHSSVVPGTDLVLEDLPDFPLAVRAHRFRCLGRTVRLAPFAPAPWVPGVSPPPPPGKGLPDVETAPRPHFELRHTVALEAIPRAGGAAYARRILHLDAQTLRPIYRIDLDAEGEPTRVVANTYLWSGDDPEGSPGWPGVPEPRTLLPFRSVALDLSTGARTRIDFGRVRSHPLPTRGKIRRLIDLRSGRDR